MRGRAAFQGPTQPLLDRVRSQPWNFGFVPLLRRLAAGQGGLPIGKARRPRDEAFRLGQVADMAFAPREIAEVLLPDAATAGGEAEPSEPAALTGNRPDLPLIRLFGLGLLGPQGPLPLHYTEWVRERSKHLHDGTLANFLDIFHHRYLTLFYRAWAQSQAAAGLDRAEDEGFSRYIAQLIGHDPLDLQGSVLPSHARLGAAAHLAQKSRHPDGLAQTVAQFFGLPVQLEEFVLHWIPIDPPDHCLLGRPGPSSLLARGALLGERVADRQGKFRLVLGPMGIERYLRFTPRGADLPAVVAWVHAFVGQEFAWELELRVIPHEAPSACLAEGPRLGWSTWLGEAGYTASRCLQHTPRGRTAPVAVVGMVFEPDGACHQVPSPTSSAATPAPTPAPTPA